MGFGVEKVFEGEVFMKKSFFSILGMLFMLFTLSGCSSIGDKTTSMSIVPEFGTQIQTIILCGTVIYEIIGPLTTKIALKKAGEIQ